MNAGFDDRVLVAHQEIDELMKEQEQEELMSRAIEERDPWDDDPQSQGGELGFCVDPFKLPFVELHNKKYLPSKPGLYFVIDGSTLLYIGKSGDLNVRWKNHHRYKQVAAIAKNPVITFLDIEDEKLLWVERMLISRFKPTLNDTRVNTVTSDKPKNADRPPRKEPNWSQRPTQIVVPLDVTFDWSQHQMAFEVALEKSDLEGKIAEIRSIYAQLQNLTVAQNKEYLELTLQLDDLLKTFHSIDSSSYPRNVHGFPCGMTEAYESSRNQALLTRCLDRLPN